MTVHLAPPPPNARTKWWGIYERGDVALGFALGFVEWYSRWRCYAFHPAPDTIFNAECLSEIQRFVDDETKKHMQAVRP